MSNLSRKTVSLLKRRKDSSFTQEDRTVDFVKQQLIKTGGLKRLVDILPYMAHSNVYKMQKIKDTLLRFFSHRDVEAQKSKVLIFVRTRRLASELLAFLNIPEAPNTVLNDSQRFGIYSEVNTQSYITPRVSQQEKD